MRAGRRSRTAAPPPLEYGQSKYALALLAALPAAKRSGLLREFYLDLAASGRREAIANPWLGQDQLRPARLRLQLLAKEADIDPEILLVARLRCPAGGQEPLVSHYLAAGQGQ